MRQRKQVNGILGKYAILFMVALCVFTACGKKRPEADPVYVRGNRYGYLYENTLFYNNYSSIQPRYQDITAVMEEGIPLYGDVLAQGEENPFDNMLQNAFILVDETATMKNKNCPVLIMTCKVNEMISIGKYKTITRIISYNTDTQKAKVLLETEEMIQSLDMYGEYIYFSTNEGELGWNIHRIDKNGKNYKKMDNSEALQYRIFSIHQDRIYLSNGADELYSVDLDLKDRQFVRSGVCSGRVAAIVGNDLIYVAYGQRLMEEDGTVKMVLLDLCRSPLSDLSETECLIPDIGGGIMYQDKLYYYVDTIQNIESGDYSRRNDILYEYSFDTRSSREIYNISGQEKHRIYTVFSNRYIICMETDKKAKEQYMIAVDLETGMERKIPY